MASKNIALDMRKPVDRTKSGRGRKIQEQEHYWQKNGWQKHSWQKDVDGVGVWRLSSRIRVLGDKRAMA